MDGIRAKSDVPAFARGVLLMMSLLLLVSGSGLAIDLARSGVLSFRPASFDINAARHLANILSRASNQLTGVVFITVAFVVPLTANLYSLKFLEFFIRDPVNATVLTLAVLINLNNTVLNYLMKEDFVPIVSLHVEVGLVILGFSLLFPYLYYIFRFLHPSTLLTRLEEEIGRHLQGAGRRSSPLAAHRRGMAEGLEHVANIAIRSVDRLDRNTAIESVRVLERVAKAYGGLKSRLPPAWFEAEARLFLSFSSKAVEELNATQTWAEMKLFSQLHQILGVAVPRMPDLTSSVAKALRRLGLEASARQDESLRELTVEYFNTFVRRAITARDIRAVFILFDQYRILAEELNGEYPDLVLEIAGYFRYYGGVARENQLTFVVEAIAHDLGALVQDAWTAGAANREALLDVFLRYDGETGTLPGVKKAQALLAGYFLWAGKAEPVARIRASFRGLDKELLRSIREDLLSVRREKYWEVNERRINLDFVPEERREKVREFFESLP
ncbi:MAG TPA: hypothetical protein VN375_03970 [Vicinamibacteria bacterium]|nr:hypothetical protein [Vicinamibacteria bacterium]